MNEQEAVERPLRAKEVAEKIRTALGHGLQEAAAIYREYVDAGGDPMELRSHVAVSADFWEVLDDLSSGRIDVGILVLTPPAMRALRTLPRVTQTSILKEGVEMLSADGSARKLPLAEVTGAQAAQVFCSHGVRSLSEQAAWLDRRRSVVVEPDSRHPAYEIKRGKLVVYEPVKLTMSELHVILAQMG